MCYNKSIIGILIFAISALCVAEDEFSRVKLSGWGFLTYGKFVSSMVEKGAKDFNFKGESYADFDAGLKVIFPVGEHGKGRLHAGVTTAFLMVEHGVKNMELKRRRLVPYLIDAALEYTFKFDNNTFFTEFGYFPVKYNPQATNLGEYLFRSNSYPNVVVSGFELADKEKLVGLHGMYKNDFTDRSWVKGDLFFNVEMSYFPLYNLSLSYIVSANFGKFLELGTGLSHQHLISVDERKTTPATDTSKWKTSTDEWEKVGHVGPNNDTVKYSFQGTKAMGRVTIDPKAFFDAPIFGSEDLKLYSEVAVLGWKNYDYWYKDRKDRMPLMFGFNFPTFKLLDVLSIEAQYWTNPWWNTAENIWKSGSPVPYHGEQVKGGSIPNFTESDTLRYHKDDWRWSVYASRKIANRVRISGQIASDNLSKTSWSSAPPSFTKYTEIFLRTKDWYWTTRVTFYF